MNCIISAWSLHEAELRGFLNKRLRNSIIAEDLLQDTFIKAMEQGKNFCDIENPRAWLFRVSKNLLIDYIRKNQKQGISEIDQDDNFNHLPQAQVQISAITTLDVCLPRALIELNTEDRQAIESCDLDGLTQIEFANKEGISITAAKSRILRARKKLKVILTNLCQINFDDSGNICCIDPQGKSACQI